MPDAKYGKLYTEQDVRLIVQTAIENDIDSETQLDAILENLGKESQLAFPADEPLFLLRGQDLLAAEAVHHYANSSAANGVDPQQQHSVRVAAQTFVDFKVQNPDRIKLPD